MSREVNDSELVEFFKGIVAHVKTAGIAREDHVYFFEIRSANL
jgi:hypothetical protein